MMSPLDQSFILCTMLCFCQSCETAGDNTTGDTLSQSDMVANQYLNLPYPAVSNEELAEQQTFYKSKAGESYPMRLYPTMTLENLNHFLFNGSQNFRWVALVRIFDSHRWEPYLTTCWCEFSMYYIQWFLT